MWQWAWQGVWQKVTDLRVWRLEYEDLVSFNLQSMGTSMASFAGVSHHPITQLGNYLIFYPTLFFQIEVYTTAEMLLPHVDIQYM